MARPGVVDRIMEIASTHDAVTPPSPSREQLLRMLRSEKRELEQIAGQCHFLSCRGPRQRQAGCLGTRMLALAKL